MTYSSTLRAGIATVALSVCASNALAANAVIMDALASRPDLSQFKAALENTGVVNELQPNASYTVFAPTNAAFAQLTQNQYPCLYSAQCAPQIADIVRNHIVPSQVYVSDVTRQKGGVYSIDNTHLSVGEPHKDNYTIEGKNITSTNQLLSNMLYRIDGVIADPQELANLRVLPYPVAFNPHAPVSEQTVTEKTYYAPDGRPDGYSKVTVVEQTYSPAR